MEEALKNELNPEAIRANIEEYNIALAKIAQEFEELEQRRRQIEENKKRAEEQLEAVGNK